MLSHTSKVMRRGLTTGPSGTHFSNADYGYFLLSAVGVYFMMKLSTENDKLKKEIKQIKSATPKVSAVVDAKVKEVEEAKAKEVEKVAAAAAGLKETIAKQNDVIAKQSDFIKCIENCKV